MLGVKRLRAIVLLGLAGGFGPALDSSALAQVVAFQPEVSPLISGALIGVTPVVSADRRYVRLSIDATFTQVNGFTPYSVPAAVSGSGGNAGIGGLHGLLGGGGGGAGGGGGTGRAGSLIAGGGGGPPVFRNGQKPEAMNWPMIATSAEDADQEARPIEPVAPSRGGQRRRIQANTKAIQAQRAAALRAARQQTLAAVRRGR